MTRQETGGEAVLDTRGLKCPLPVIELARRSGDLTGGGSLTVLADDPAARADIPAWCRMKGHPVTIEEHARHTAYHVGSAGGSGG